MAAPRAEIPIVVLSESSPASYVSGATVFVKIRSTEATATVYANSGASEATIAQPLTTDSLGRITGWLPRGAYKVEITIPGKSPYTEYLDVFPGSEGSVDTAAIAGEAVTSEKIASAVKNAAAGTPSLRSLGTGSTEAAAGNDSRLSNERVPTAGSVSTAKIVDGSVTEAKLANGAATSTKVKPTILSKLSTAEKTYGATLEEVPGTSLTFTLAANSVLWVSMNALFYGSYPSSDQCRWDCYMYADGVKKTPAMLFGPTWPSLEKSVAWEITLQQTFPLELAAGEHTLMMKARIRNNVGSTYKTLVAEGGTFGTSEATGWRAVVFST